MVKRIFKFLFSVIFILIGVSLVSLLTKPFYRRLVVYPRLERAREDLSASYRLPNAVIPMPEFRGVMHAHSFWSHDSRGNLREILEGAKQAELDFIFFADHARNKLDTFPRSYHGLIDGVIFEAGTETSGDAGMMVNPFREGVLDWNIPRDSMIRDVVKNGGLVTYVHSEKDHEWDNPDYQAMEIYNIHTDLLDEGGLLPFLVNHMVNGSRYRHWGYRELYDKQIGILANWDRINQNRKVTGIGSVDAHHNQNIRARFEADGRVEWVGPNAKTLSIREPGLIEGILLGDPDEDGWVFEWGLDTYFHSFNFVNNHVFAEAFTSEEIKKGIIKANSFVVFESLAKGDGFQFFALNAQGELAGILGDSIAVDHVEKLKVLSPFPARFRLIHDGILLTETREASFEFEYSTQGQKGNYRIEADLQLDRSWLNWVFTNPIYVH